MLVEAATTKPDQFRALATMQATEHVAQMAKTMPESPALANAQTALQSAQSAPFSQREALRAIANDPDLNKLFAADLISKPATLEGWLKQWPTSIFAWLAHIAGILVTMGLLTLGAPVWYEILKNLVQFRSLIARKDDVERAARQTSQKPAG